VSGPVRSRTLLGALALVTACWLAACGSSGPAAEDEASAVAVRALETKDAKEFCKRLASQRLIEEFVVGGPAACEKASSVVSEGPGTARVTEVALRGEDESRAELAVALEGGETGGVSGHVEVVRVGDRWLLDGYGDDFLRSSMLVAIRKVDGGAIANQRMKVCMGGQIEKVGADRMREIFRAGTSGGEILIKALLPFAENCPAALAENAADEFTKGLTKDGKNSPAYVKCLHDEIEGLLLLTDITPELLGEHPGSIAVAALEGIATGAKRNCIGKK
jgi:hypothetical protein